MEIKNSYLMWIGAEHYPTIESWASEAAEMGVSKRLPNEHMGTALMEPGTVVFVAHDEGKYTDCGECGEVIICGECRKRREGAARLRDEAVELREQHGDTRLNDKDRASALRKAVNREEKAKELEGECTSCEECMGNGELTAGSGGHVVFENGKRWDYRHYNYHLHQPTKWTPAEEGGITEIKRCESCGGTGRLPLGMIFGFFVPEALEKIVTGEEEAKEAAAKGIRPVSVEVVKSERKRGCGKRKAGGVYVTTSGSPIPSKAATAVADALADKGLGEVEVKGNFVRFLAPVPVHGMKRFRGLGLLPMDAVTEALAEAAEMAADAVA
jgi:hypothetical protein